MPISRRTFLGRALGVAGLLAAPSVIGATSSLPLVKPICYFLVTGHPWIPRPDAPCWQTTWTAEVEPDGRSRVYYVAARITRAEVKSNSLQGVFNLLQTYDDNARLSLEDAVERYETLVRPQFHYREHLDHRYWSNMFFAAALKGGRMYA